MDIEDKKKQNKIKLTDKQMEVLKDESKNLLVSASAGSGKTATIIEKILSLIVSGKISVDKFLIITFTEDASAEMKLRLKDKLYECSVDQKYLAQEIDKLSTSDISTIHGFCLKQIRKYFFILNVNPNFVVLGEKDSKLLKSLAMDRVIKDYSKKDDEDFVRLSSLLDGGRKFETLKDEVLKCHEFFCSVEEPSEFQKNTVMLCYDNDFEKNVACKLLNSSIKNSFFYFKKSLEGYLVQAKIQKAILYSEYIKTLLDIVSQIDFNGNYFDNRSKCLNMIFPAQSKRKLDENDTAFKEEFQAFYDKMKKQFEQIKSTLCPKQTEDEVKYNLSLCQKEVEKLIQVVNSFDTEYKKLKDHKNALDFSDLEKYFSVLIDDEYIAKDIAKNYEYIFVDEYQDINGVQEKILKRLSKFCKIVMVGDVKQSIYGFRNSSPKIFVDKSIAFKNDFNKGNFITLNENFRSEPQILNFVNSIFSKIMTNEFGGVDYQNDSMLDGKTKYEKTNDFLPIKICVVDKKKEDEEIEQKYTGVYSVKSDKNKYNLVLTDERREAMIVAKNILDMIGKKYYDAKNKCEKEITYSDIAILGRDNKFLKNLCVALCDYQIPISANINEQFLGDKDVNIFVSLLKIINNPHDDISLCIVLTSFFGKFSFDELSIIRKDFPEEKNFYESFVKYSQKNESEIFDEKERTIFCKTKNFLSFVDDLRFKLSSFMTIYDLFLHLDNKFHYFDFLNSLPGGFDRVGIVKSYIESFKDANYNTDLSSYISYLEGVSGDEKVSISKNVSSNSVKVGTIHSSKGLEFPIVFLVGVNKSFSKLTFRSEFLKDSELGVGVSTFDLNKHEKIDNIAKNAIAYNLHKKEKAEELRLLYVALTRAKNNLIIVGHTALDKVKKIEDFSDAEGADSFMPWILSGLSDVAFGAILNGKEKFVDKQKQFEVEVNVFDLSSFEKEKIKKISDIELTRIESDEELKKILNFNLETSNNIALKNSVSSILREHTDGMASFNDEPRKLKVFENDTKGKINASMKGTVYHKILQEIEFNKINFNEAYLNSVIKGCNFCDDELKLIQVDDILTCVKAVLSLGGVRYKKELEFISYLPYCEIFLDSNIDDKIVVQGVADLLIETKEHKYMLVDYKTNKVSNPDQLVEKYSLQLKLYKLCLEKALNIKIDSTLIYSFGLKKFIKI